MYVGAELRDDGRIWAVRVPIGVSRRGGRKVVVAPDGAALPPSRHKVDSALVKALARVFRWRKLMESGVYGTIAELAAAEKFNASYVSRLLRLTLLPPAIVEAILDGRQAPVVTTAGLMRLPALGWETQRELPRS